MEASEHTQKGRKMAIKKIINSPRQLIHRRPIPFQISKSHRWFLESQRSQIQSTPLCTLNYNRRHSCYSLNLVSPGRTTKAEPAFHINPRDHWGLGNKQQPALPLWPQGLLSAPTNQGKGLGGLILTLISLPASLHSPPQKAPCIPSLDTPPSPWQHPTGTLPENLQCVPSSGDEDRSSSQERARPYAKPICHVSQCFPNFSGLQNHGGGGLLKMRIPVPGTADSVGAGWGPVTGILHKHPK